MSSFRSVPNTRRPASTPSSYVNAPWHTAPSPRSVTEGLHATSIMTIDKPDSAGSDKDLLPIGLKYIGSYNWTEAPLKRPTIIVPGSPREWTNKRVPFSVKRDDNIVFVDQNGYRVPDTPLLPLIQAVNTITPDFDWPAVDIVTDRNGLRKLLRWIDGSATKDFRIDMQLAGAGTVLFNRWEARTREGSKGGYGFSFEHTTTRPASGCAESTGHHRIVSYEFDGLRMVVRFEVDACFPDTPTTHAGSNKTPTTSSNVDALTDLLGHISLGSTSTPNTNNQTSPAPATLPRTSTSILKIIQAGHVVPQANVIELTTRSQYTLDKTPYNWTEAFPQLFLSQTSHHFLAVHVNGNFTRVEKRKIGSDELRSVESLAQDSFRKLGFVLHEIKEILLERGSEARLSLVYREGELKIFERESDKSCLPEDTLRLFEAISSESST